jgi:hypothetical protein
MRHSICRASATETAEVCCAISRGALKNTGPERGDKGTARAASGGQRDDAGAAAAIDPAVIGTAKDYQLAVAVKRLKEMVARGTAGGRS